MDKHTWTCYSWDLLQQIPDAFIYIHAPVAPHPWTTFRGLDGISLQALHAATTSALTHTSLDKVSAQV